MAEIPPEAPRQQPEDELKKRVFLFRGFTMDELRRLSMDSFIKLLDARKRRSLLRGIPKRQKKLLEKLRAAKRALKKGKTIIVRTHVRDMVVLPEFVGLTIAVYNGMTFLELLIVPEMIGRLTGEFAPTNKAVRHGAPGIGATKSSQFVPLK
ncbi:MAG: 30S ribosomal protein S19 [Candidatus Lokiarchaeota archaeon]|nr:30S ribosomal protein S19 [Candidatus Lokiarchaeota archaeon]